MTQSAIDAFNRALHSPERMKPDHRKEANASRIERRKFKQYHAPKAQKEEPWPTPPQPVHPVKPPRPEFEPYVIVHGSKGTKKRFRYLREVDHNTVIRAHFEVLADANRFARHVNLLYK